ncbi:hypothetical protein ABIB06_006581 [Bradyrhizobium sp. LB8.2]|uniref:hypothetical protein n=1 Tax=unclassified Bradyrhizobium TaxID=2631580 RepID=UPI003392A88B
MKKLLCMEIIDKIMQTYGMMVPLTSEEERAARERLVKFLSDKSDDARKLTIEGLKFLRGERPARTRRARSPI